MISRAWKLIAGWQTVNIVRTGIVAEPARLLGVTVLIPGLPRPLGNLPSSFCAVQSELQPDEVQLRS